MSSENINRSFLGRKIHLCIESSKLSKKLSSRNGFKKPNFPLSLT